MKKWLRQDKNSPENMSSFSRFGFDEMPSLVSRGRCNSLLNWMCRNIATQKISGGDAGVEKCFAFPQPSFQKKILEFYRPTIEQRIRKRLLPSYAYGRIYLQGAILPPHKDRKECELSVTINLGGASNESWPLCIEGADGVLRQFLLKQGDALVFDGRKLVHWRPELSSEWQAQLFLHFLWSTDSPASSMPAQSPHKQDLEKGRY